MRGRKQAANAGVGNYDYATEALGALGQHINPLSQCLRAGDRRFSGYQLVGGIEQHAVRRKRFL
ncbi:hypothetical protein D3C86_1761770 [compost metagenome]